MAEKVIITDKRDNKRDNMDDKAKGERKRKGSTLK